jgi:hypothetical protein
VVKLTYAFFFFSNSSEKKKNETDLRLTHAHTKQNKKLTHTYSRIKKSVGYVKPEEKKPEVKPISVTDAASTSSMSFREKLKELTEAHRDGLLNKDEFEGAKKDAVNQFLSR